MTHCLVVGGTGMLQAVCAHVAQSSQHLSVLSRRPERLVLPDQACTVHPLAVDYVQEDELRSSLQASVAHNGPFNLVICWIHGSAPHAPLVVGEIANQTPCTYLHVLGSDSSRQTYHEQAKAFSQFENIFYKQVILGFKREHNRSRWLTHQEIGDGVIQAISSEDQRCIVGAVEPWSERP